MVGRVTEWFLQGDIMVDAHYKNLDHFSGQTILFKQPHNEGHDDKGIQGFQHGRMF